MAYNITEKCSGCTACAHICPTGAVTGEKEERHQIDEHSCIECDACGKVCPDMAVQDASGNGVQRVKHSEWKKPFFDKQKCNGCAICLDVCPTDCISFVANGEEEELRARLSAPAGNLAQDLYVSADLPTTRVMVKDEDVCLHCGLCAERCPTTAWDMQKFLYNVAKAGQSL